LEEEVSLDGETVGLSVNKYGGTLHPTGHEYLEEFRLDPFPTFLYSCGLQLEKTIYMAHGHNALVVSYKILEGDPALVRLYPLVNFRGIHTLTKMERSGNFKIDGWDKGFKVTDENQNMLIVGSDALRYHASDLSEEAKWHRNMEYEIEGRRGYDSFDDHYSPGFFELEIEKGSRFNILATAGYNAEDSFQALYSSDPSGFDELRRAEEKRYEEISGGLPVELRHLAGAADSFLVGKKSKMVIAGYHWFSTWGRDALISLPGLCLVTGRYDDAQNILSSYASYCRNGVIPNFVGRGGASYNSVDASLWFIYALHKYLAYTDDVGSCIGLWPVVEDIIIHYKDGKHLGEGCTVRMDSDGLLKIDGEQSQVTWMDAKINEHAVTPRAGKPVEVNALWYNALRAASMMSKELGEDSSIYAEMAENTRKGFKSFWNESKGCLYDVIGGDGGDPSIRPNQLFATSLPFSVLDGKTAKGVIKRVKKELLTPYGIRSLSPKDERYIGVYQGGQTERDSAYHMGTVWSWLMGPYVTSFLKVHKYSKSALKEADDLLNPLIVGHSKEVGLGSISEIFDGDPPHNPRGCISQAWSVAEVLRCYVEDIQGMRPPHEGKWCPD
ncbi:MAG: amylo-alpha-1,6-glucosidase, partial [Candidatus Hydrothermarchaeales archaeon]